MWRRVLLAIASAALLALAGCVSIVGVYDPFFDQTLNQLSSDSAKFLAVAADKGPGSRADSKEAKEYYAATENVLDRLDQRADAKKGSVACAGNATLKNLHDQTENATDLPDGYLGFDCRQAILYVVRLALEQLKNAEAKRGVLTNADNDFYGQQLEAHIATAIRVVLENKT